MDYFEGRFRDWNIKVLDTGQESDTAQRIYNCRDHVGDRFFATYGDGLGDVDLHALIEFHQKAGGLATLTSVPLRSQYGTMLFEGGNRISEFREKPVIEDCWINAGFFVFEKSVFDVWEGKNLEVDVFPALAHRGAIFAYKHFGFWKSMDTSKDLQELERIYHQSNIPWLPQCMDRSAAQPGAAA